ncbi:hypothetical protein D3C80_1469860 [compost metagenome]
MQEAGIAFVCFGDQVAAGAQLGIGTGSGQAATDDEGRVQATGGEHRGQQAGGGGLAMGTGDRDAVAVAHQLGEHLGPRHHRNASLKRRGHFRVGGIDGAGHHQHIGAGGVLGTVTDEDLRTEGFQTLGNRRGLEVGARHLVTQVQQHFGNTAHAHTADTDEVDATDTAHFRLWHGFFVLNHGPPPDRYRPRCGWQRAWPGAGQWRPWW